MEVANSNESTASVSKRFKTMLPIAALVLTGCGSERSAAGEEPIIGYDVSAPQCGQALPTDKDFAIVGVNQTNARGLNPCFEEQLDWARSLPDSGGHTAMYVLTGNPGNAVDSEKVTTWPSSGRNQYGNCDGNDSAACSYEYGRERAQADLDHAGPDAPKMVWLNVEAGNFSWLEPAQNKAALEGMTEAFRQASKTVGVYSDTETWQQLVGGIPDKDSNLYGLDEWILGAHNLDEARQNCRQLSFTGGRIVLAQMAGDAYPIDQDFVCP